jgi:hypothetical protein
MFLISLKFPARSEQVEHCFLARTLDCASYRSYCTNINCKMAGLAETWSNIEMRSVIRFLRLRGTSPAEIHRQLVEVYGANVMSPKHVWVWCTAFDNGQPHAWVVTALQLGGTGPSSLQPWPGTERFSSLLTVEEAPGWKAIRNRRWSSASRHVLASDAWHWFLLCWDGCLGVPVGQMFRQVWGLCGKMFSTKAVLLIIRVYTIWINLRNERTCLLIYWTALVSSATGRVTRLKAQEPRDSFSPHAKNKRTLIWHWIYSGADICRRPVS